MRVIKAVVIVTLMFGAATALNGQFQASQGLAVTLTREYGRSRWTQCRLTVTFASVSPRVGPRPPMASLECTKGNQQPVTANAEVGPEESRRLTALVENPALWSGQAIGTDKRRSDGVFERIEVRARETFGTVVTSGNPSFSTDPVRREFLTLLTTIEGQLRSSTPALR